MRIGIFSASSQSGRAYLADLSNMGIDVYGYCRESLHGQEFVNTVYKQKGLVLKRPASNTNHEASSKLVPMSEKNLGHDLNKLLQTDVIILAEPSIYFRESAKILKEAGILKKEIPLILSPSRTFTVPEIWKILGDRYPVICFSTCIYSCKAPDPGTSFIKRRKRSWIASIEGNVDENIIKQLTRLFKQCVWSNLPAATSLGNIGMVFHPSTYLLNYEKIISSQTEKKEFSFYMDGIASNPIVGKYIESIDKTRLKLSEKLGIRTYIPGRKQDEDEWKKIMEDLYLLEGQNKKVEELRSLRHKKLDLIKNCVVGAQFWLDYTYGVRRIENEPLYKTIARTPTYQKMSVPQNRYIEEDVPTGLLPLYVFSKKMNLDVENLEYIIALYEDIKGNSQQWIKIYDKYSVEYIKNYLLGNFGGI